MVVASEFQSKILRRQKTAEEFRVYRAGLEWDLTDPIVIDGPDDFKSTQRWRDRVDPYHHQVTNLITFCRRLPVTLLADDVGLGKTISAGLIVSELIARSRVSKILIVCPKLLGPQWKDELESKFDIPAEIAIGKELKTADPSEIGAVITTYNSARLYLDSIPEDRFQMLILDEAHKLRNLYGVEKTPQVAKRFRKALEARRFRFVLMLTATPIQNRLWDLYSLVDLLTVARGHQNPFGSQGMFTRRFIADGREEARQLKAENREEFRSIVYGYMSRVRRGDARLQFPDRMVQMHKVDPSPAELALIQTIAKPIQLLNRLAQISILQALASSPDALNTQLSNMARKGTVPADLAAKVRSIVLSMPASAKLRGLERLVERLEKENPDRWRLVVFTGRRETQTTIQAFLESRGLKVGIINGDSGQRNQDTIVRFRRNPPEYRVIVSTEAGSEGVNLQVANVLVNFDLPWNPMIVEQRIGRVQRLASEHAHVSIFNIMLKGTFEEYIVGRLTEKLQMASHAIGDIESLLQGSDIGDGDGDGATAFEEKILALVLAALRGKNVEEEMRLAERSIADAKATLDREEANINTMLGSMEGMEYVGPRAPKLPTTDRSMAAKDFTLAALRDLGARVSPVPPDLYVAERDGRREYIRFQEPEAPRIKSTLYSPQSPAFQRLVDQVVATGVHRVEDIDRDPHSKNAEIARVWIQNFGATPKEISLREVRRTFIGNALLRVRATVAHDSYERLVDVKCDDGNHSVVSGRGGLVPLPATIDNPSALGLQVERLTDAAELDPNIAEFSRFYLERRNQEVQAAAGDERKRMKLEDEFTPRLSITFVGADGRLNRELVTHVRYAFESGPIYEDTIRIVPFLDKILDGPEFRQCMRLDRLVPVTCLAKCEISGAEVLKHFLVKSDVSGRVALPEHSAVCDHSGKSVLRDEADVSSVTGKLVANIFLRSSPRSGSKAEVEHFARCAFTQTEVLKSELSTSQISGKLYLAHEQVRSAVSGKTGHKSEFITCHETRQLISHSEAETCELTGRQVRLGVLESCAVTGRRALPSELERCATTSKRALKYLLVTSSLSQARILEESAVRASSGVYCTIAEAQACSWSGRKCHPDDLKVCGLTGLTVHHSFTTERELARLRPLVEMLDGARKSADRTESWDVIAAQVLSIRGGGRARIESATLSPSQKLLAVCCEIRTMFGFRVHQIGVVYDLAEQRFTGRSIEGKRRSDGWTSIP
ncbi:MAG: DEAD/DEAH box helicase [Proteobacteria bacterium]|nr:DEAD/DEAH box helicase [Pseudomonadota bacterium]